MSQIENLPVAASGTSLIWYLPGVISEFENGVVPTSSSLRKTVATGEDEISNPAGFFRKGLRMVQPPSKRDETRIISSLRIDISYHAKTTPPYPQKNFWQSYSSECSREV